MSGFFFCCAMCLPAWGLLGGGAGSSAQPIDKLRVQDVLRARLESRSPGGELAAGGEFILSEHLVPLFYRQRGFLPAWIGDEEKRFSRVDALLQAIKKAEDEGLGPDDYHLARIEELAKQVRRHRKKGGISAEELASDLELLSSDAFLTLASHLRQGKVHFETLETAWEGACVETELVLLLEDALTSGELEERLLRMAPRHPFYSGLKKALAFYRGLANKRKHDPIPEGLTLKKGDRGKAVQALSRCLARLGDLPGREKRNQSLFDDLLEAALRRFQSRHGLDANGTLDEPTLTALNIPLQERVSQLELNLERWRWMPHDLGPRFIYINIANFELGAYENGRRVLAMKVVAGNEAWQTPDFSSQMTHLVLNPYWTIPIPVLLKETVNYILQDPNYLRSNKMVVLQGRGEEEKELDPCLIDWSRLNENNLSFRIRQDPGPLNVLGRLKFVFPNEYEVFLHDTPYQEDFAKAVRAFSHGCIRAEKPVELAEFVLRGRPRWDTPRILAALETAVDKTVRLAEPMDVYFLYSTAWCDEDGTVEFRPDIYERDRKLGESLSRRPPSPRAGLSLP